MEGASGDTASDRAGDRERGCEEDFGPFPNENLFQTGGCMIRFALCKDHSVYGERTGDR